MGCHTRPLHFIAAHSCNAPFISTSGFLNGMARRRPATFSKRMTRGDICNACVGHPRHLIHTASPYLHNIPTFCAWNGGRGWMAGYGGNGLGKHCVQQRSAVCQYATQHTVGVILALMFNERTSRCPGVEGSNACFPAPAFYACHL